MSVSIAIGPDSETPNHHWVAVPNLIAEAIVCAVDRDPSNCTQASTVSLEASAVSVMGKE